MQRLAEVAFEVNEKTENIGARRLHTVMERLLETVSFDAADRGGTRVVIDRAYVESNLGELVARSGSVAVHSVAPPQCRSPPTSSFARNRESSKCASTTVRVSSCHSSTCGCSRPPPRSPVTAVGEGILQMGKENVGISGVEPVGNYALRLKFDDGHNTGLYSWTLLHELGAAAGTRTGRATSSAAPRPELSAARAR